VRSHGSAEAAGAAVVEAFTLAAAVLQVVVFTLAVVPARALRRPTWRRRRTLRHRSSQRLTFLDQAHTLLHLREGRAHRRVCRITLRYRTLPHRTLPQARSPQTDLQRTSPRLRLAARPAVSLLTARLLLRAAIPLRA
jgi:hypothetical protein